MAPRLGERSTIVPVKDPVREKAAAVIGEVKAYKLSPEELEDLRTRTGYKEPPQNADGEAIKPPVCIPPTITSEEQSKRAKGRKPSSVPEPSKQEFLRQIANGKTIAAIGKSMGINPSGIYYWVKKWDLTGITPGKARELLGEPAGTEAPKQQQPTESSVDVKKVMAELQAAKDDLNIANQKIEILEAKLKHENETAVRIFGEEVQKKQAAEAEINRLVKELSVANLDIVSLRNVNRQLAAEVEKRKNESTEIIALAGEAQEQMQAEIDRLRDELAKKIGALNAAEQTICSWQKSNLERGQENQRLRDDKAELLKEVSAKEAEIAALVKERDEALVKLANMEAARGSAQAAATHDSVKHPNHYTAGGIETIDFMRAKMTPEQFEGYCLGNVIKYTSSFRLKNGVEDLRKAEQYLVWMIERAAQ
ncbi:MAG: hypothetical protein K0Q73_5641 [Paenibacillus sp.]|jgi:hypothetical protein|nr:hypothetical protein [Paenibacillus sp.]